MLGGSSGTFRMLCRGSRVGFLASVVVSRWGSWSTLNVNCLCVITDVLVYLKVALLSAALCLIMSVERFRLKSGAKSPSILLLRVGLKSEMDMRNERPTGNK